MMKKLVTTTLAALLAAPMSLFAVGGDFPMAGCGLGYVLFGHERGGEPLVQVLAATTNATSGNQTFGMTSGTSGCTEDGAVRFVKEAEVFADVNLDTLRREMAAGEGEFVTSFAALLGATESEIPALVQLFRDEYQTLFPSADTSSADMMAALKQIIASRVA